MSAELSGESKLLLEKAGWYPGRQIDTDAFEEALTVYGYEMSPVVRAFLAEFGNLRITFPYDKERGSSATLYLEPTVDTVPYARDHLMQRFACHVGKPICPIGAYQNETLVMDPDGRVYLGDGDYVDLIGESGPDAIENIFGGKDITYSRIAAPKPTYRGAIDPGQKTNDKSPSEPRT